VSVWHVAAVAVFLGAVNAFDIPARQSFIVELVGKDDLMNAIALNSSMFNAARIVGPAVAGALIGAFGVAICFLLNGVSYLAVIAGLLAMRVPPPRAPVAPHGAWSGLREALAFLHRDRRILTLVVLMGVLSIFGSPYLVMMPVFARDILHRGATGYGVLMTSVGAGAMIGALGVALFGRRIHQGPTLIAAGITFGLLLVAFALSRVYVLSVALLVLAGGTMILNNALANTAIQTIVPDQLRGRVMGFFSFVFVGLAPLGALQVGTLAERIGTPHAVALGGVVTALAVAVAAWRVPELRTTV
jgi:MFS family permease